jgi:hypothetical protein
MDNAPYFESSRHYLESPLLLFFQEQYCFLIFLGPAPVPAVGDMPPGSNSYVVDHLPTSALARLCISAGGCGALAGDWPGGRAKQEIQMVRTPMRISAIRSMVFIEFSPFKMSSDGNSR